MQSLVLRDKSYSVESLPSEPSLLVELLDLCRNDDANFDMFASSISKDAALTAKIIQVANSPAYRQWNEVTELKRMLIVLGMTNIRNIVTTCTIQQFFSSFTISFSRHVQFIWFRSLVCANLTERLGKLIGYEKPGEAFLAGLLHQVGMLLLLLNKEQQYIPLLDRYYEETENFCALEKDQFEINHCDLGAALIDSWKMDSFLADAVQFQLCPAEELKSSPMLLKLLSVASPLSSKNSARENQSFLQKAGLLFDMTEDTILDCLDLAIEKSTKMITDLGFSGRFYLEDNEDSLFDEELHTQKSKEVGDQVKNMALSGTVARSEKTELVELTKELRANFSTIFNINQLFFFKINDEQDRLTPINDLKINQLEEIEFRTDDSNSVLVTAFKNREPKLTLNETCAIADRQILRILGVEGAYILPISHKKNCIGVIAIGTSQADWRHLEEKTDLFQLLSLEIARKFVASLRDAGDNTSMSAVEFRKVAHEVSNPLTIINNYLYMLGRKIDSDHPAQEEIKLISEEIERAGNILLRAKDPDAPSRAKESRININQLVKEIDTLLMSSLYKTNRVESTLCLDGDMPSIYCSKDKLKQILLNLVKNAIEASDEGGHLNLSTRDNYYQNGRQYVEIVIKDNGPGIPADILKNLFQPVTSTKEGHSGLGLTIVSTLVDELSGQISCHSSPAEGTEFKILIPRFTELIDLEMD